MRLKDDPRLATYEALVASGRSQRSVAEEFGISEDGLNRHIARYGLSQTLPTPSSPSAGPERSLRDRLEQMVSRLEAQAGQSQGRAFVDAAREVRLALSELSRIGGASDRAVKVADVEDWPALRTLLLSALAPWPEARQTVVEALRASVEGQDDA